MQGLMQKERLQFSRTIVMLEISTPKFIKCKVSSTKKTLKLRPKIPYLGIFKLEFEKKAIVIFDPAPSNSSKCKVLCKTKKYLLTKYLLWVF